MKHSQYVVVEATNPNEFARNIEAYLNDIESDWKLYGDFRYSHGLYFQILICETYR